MKIQDTNDMGSRTAWEISMGDINKHKRTITDVAEPVFFSWDLEILLIIFWLIQYYNIK